MTGDQPVVEVLYLPGCSNHSGAGARSPAASIGSAIRWHASLTSDGSVTHSPAPPVALAGPVPRVDPMAR